MRLLVWVPFLESGFPTLTCVHADSELWPLPVRGSVLPKLCFKTCLYHCPYSWLLFFSAALLVLLALAVVPSWPTLAFFVAHDSALTNAMIPGIWPQPDPVSDSACPLVFPEGELVDCQGSLMIPWGQTVTARCAQAPQPPEGPFSGYSANWGWTVTAVFCQLVFIVLIRYFRSLQCMLMTTQ